MITEIKNLPGKVTDIAHIQKILREQVMLAKNPDATSELRRLGLQLNNITNDLEQSDAALKLAKRGMPVVRN